MSEHAIAKREPMDFGQMEKAAEVMANSGLFPVWNSKERVMTLMMLCQAEGIDPLTGVNRYDYINGRIAKKATAIQADFQAMGGKVEWVKCTNEVAKVKITTPEGTKHEEEFTIDDARQAQLVKPNSGWTKYPKAMLRARCITFAIRAACPQVLNLMLSSEEAQDTEPVREINVTPMTITETLAQTSEEDQLIKEEPTEEVSNAKDASPEEEPEQEESGKGEEEAVEPEVVEPVDGESEEVVDEFDEIKEWMKSLGVKEVNAFLKSINWPTMSKLTDENLTYIIQNKPSFEGQVKKLAKGE